MQLRGNTALVTGAGSGAGRGIGLALARAGCRVVVVDIDRSGGEATVESARAAGGRVEFFEADVADEAAARAMVAFAEARFGGLDLMVNNAGVVEYHTGRQTSFPDVPVDLWSRMLDINLRGVVLGTQFGIEAMKKRGGAIVNVASGAGIGLGPNDAPVYAASKAGVVRFTAALAFLKDEYGIRVNCICPGWIDSAMSRRTRAEMTPAEWAAIAPKTMLSPDELAVSVLRLLRDERLAGRVMLHYEGEQPRLLRRDRAKS